MPYGAGKYTYELVDVWAKLPEGWVDSLMPGLSNNSHSQRLGLTLQGLEH